jgi:hypothetical protein
MGSRGFAPAGYPAFALIGDISVFVLKPTLRYAKIIPELCDLSGIF